MVKILASHAAGYRLARIIGFLMIPIFYLSFVLISDTLHERASLRANRDALQLMDLTFQTMLDYAGGSSISDQRARLLEQGPVLAASVGVKPEFQALQKAFELQESSRQDILQKAASLMMALGNGPGMNIGGDREANGLAMMSGDLLPHMVLNYNQIHMAIATSMADHDMIAQKLPDIASGATTLEFIARQLAMDTVQARALSDNPTAYSRLLQTSWWLTFDAAHDRGLAFGNHDDSVGTVHNLESAMSDVSHKWITTVGSVWNDIDTRLVEISNNKQSELNSWSLKTLGFSMVAILLGLGAAVSMFRKTLRQLDDLDLSRQRAVEAQASAERGSAELADMNSNMAQINVEMSSNLRALRAAQDQLVKKTRMEQMGQLTATIAHELRNPLGAVRTSAFLLERKTRGKELGIEGQLQRINNGVTRCDTIITQLLDFSRNKQIVTSSEDLDSWLERTVAEDAQRLPSMVAISCSLGLSGLHVPFDSSRLQRAISNLLSNASEAMVGNGDGQFHGSTSDPVIAITTRHAGEFVEIEIKDNGPGIKPDDMRRIREPLFTTKNFGTGLGLPAVEQIVAQHGGTLRVVSEYGQGAAFTLQIPCLQIVESAA
jgi:signal transduction histidine kinase